MAAEFVVVDEEGGAARALEGGGAVVVGRGVLAGLQPGPAGVGDDLVPEAGGQGEDPVRVGDQRPVADPAVIVAVAVLLPRAVGVRGREGVGRGGEGADAARQHDPGSGERGAAGEVPAAERHGVSCDGERAVEDGGPRSAVTLPRVPEREPHRALNAT